jgi:hypothetical protein
MGALCRGPRQWRGLRLHELGDRIHGVARQRRSRGRLEEEGTGVMPSQIHYLQAWCRQQQAREGRRRQRRITANLERGLGDEFGDFLCVPQSIDSVSLGLGVLDRLAHFCFLLESAHFRLAMLAGWIRPKNIAGHVQAS